MVSKYSTISTASDGDTFTMSSYYYCVGEYVGDGLSLHFVGSYSKNIVSSTYSAAAYVSIVLGIFGLAVCGFLIWNTKRLRSQVEEIRQEHESKEPDVSRRKNSTSKKDETPRETSKSKESAQSSEFSKASKTHDGKKKSMSYKFLVDSLSLAICLGVLMLGGIWITWEVYSENTLSETSLTAVECSTEVLHSTIGSAFDTIDTSVLVLKSQYDQGNLADGDSEYEQNERDAILYRLMYALHEDISWIYSVSITFSDGDMTGVWYYNGTNSSNPFVIGASNSLEGFSFYEVNSTSHTRINSSMLKSKNSYNPASERWYTSASQSSDLVISSPYTYVDDLQQTIVVAGSLAIRSKNDDVEAVVTVMADLEKLSSSFSAVETYSVIGYTSWIMDLSKILVASTSGSIVTNYAQSYNPLIATDSEDSTISSTVTYVSTYLDGELSSISTSVHSIERPFNDPVTYLHLFNKSDYGATWVVFYTFDYDTVYDFDSISDLTLLLFGFIGIFTLLIVAGAGFSFLFEIDPQTKKKMNKLVSKNLDISGAYFWYKQLFEVVIGALCGNWTRDPTLAHRPLSVSLVNEKRLKAAQLRYFDAAQGRDIAISCYMEASSNWVYRLFIWNSGPFNRTLVKTIVFLHLFMTFLEPASPALLKSNGLRPYQIILELLCIVIELQDAVIKAILLHLSLNVKNTIENIQRKLFDQILLILVIIAVLTDLVLTISLRVSFEYYLPIKVLIVMTGIPEIRKIFFAFLKTIKAAQNVFVLYFTLIIIAAGMGHILLRTTVNAGSVSNSYSTFFRSVITMFVYISTADNYQDLVYTASESSTAYLLYFIVWFVFGTVFVMALVLSYFQDGFTEALREALLKLKINDRLGMIGSFILIDLNDSGTIDRTEFKKFAVQVNQYAGDEDLDEIFDELDVDRSCREEKGILNIKEFVDGIERSSHLIERIDFEAAEPSDYFLDEGVILRNEPLMIKLGRYGEIVRWHLYPIVSSKHFDTMVLVCIAFQVFILSIYGSIDDSQLQTLDVLNGVLVLINFCDIVLKVFVYRRAFFFWSNYRFERPDGRWQYGDAAQQLANNVDFMIVMVSFVLFVVSRGLSGSFTFSDDEDGYRVMMTVPIFRLFTQVQSTLSLIYTLIVIMPQFASLFSLLMVAFYVFAVYGVLFFKDTFSTLLQSSAPDGNFDSFKESWVTLFQLFVGQSWNEYLYAGVKVKSSYAASLYFMLFVQLVTILITNVIIALVLTVSQKVAGKRNISQYEINKSLLEDGPQHSKVVTIRLL
eukprot:TRINITY_DN1061_c0_g1_i2.p1 TRINITY_DN1061_c0_g1~~TRINITY_DN1061_c0_g1_i2.p1  ORF type:complete len:1273 (-),score=298.37 TRINITY_DN1061_c0_g1_i2:82-3900(-)